METCIAEGERILRELRRRGDNRNWIAAGIADARKSDCEVYRGWSKTSNELLGEPTDVES